MDSLSATCNCPFIRCSIQEFSQYFGASDELACKFPLTTNQPNLPLKTTPFKNHTKRGTAKVCIYKSSCSEDSNRVRRALEDAGIAVSIADCSNTVPFTDTVSRHLEVLIYEYDIPIARKVFKKNRIVGTGYENLGLDQFRKPIALLAILVGFIVFFPLSINAIESTTVALFAFLGSLLLALVAFVIFFRHS